MFTDHWQPGWRDCYHAWLTQVYQRSGSDATTTNYTSVLKRFFEATGKEPQMVLKSDVELWASSPLVQGNKGKVPAPYTRNARIMAISSFYSYACAFEYADGKGVPVTLTERNPCKGIKQSRAQPSYRSVSLEEFQQLCAVIPRDTVRGSRDFALLQALFWSCRRREEIVSLVWGNLRQVTFNDPKTQKTREGWTYTTRIKGGGTVTAEMPLPAALAILEHLRISGRLATIDDSMPIFIGFPPHEWPPVDPWRHLDGNEVWRRMKKYLRLAGMDETVSPHFLRHGGALARYLYADSGPVEIMGLLHHSNLKVTTVYLRDLNMRSNQDLAALRLQKNMDHCREDQL